MKAYSDSVIEEIIINESIITVFQPILSIKKRSLVGLEALTRGYYNNKIIMPDSLFALASAAGLTVDLDRLCRKKALETFSSNKSRLDKDIILFLNFDASIIDQGVVGSGILLSSVNGVGINPNSVAIEINESVVTDIDSLQTFISLHRSYGFIIAMDDIGAGHSNLNRVDITRPDFLKIDRTLVKDLDKEYYKQEVFKSLINLARNTGSLVVAEGVERVEEAIAALDFGVDMIQGFHFSEPREISSIPFDNLTGRMENVASVFKEHALQRITLKNIQDREYEAILNSVINELKDLRPADFDKKLGEVITRHGYLECIYILDESAIQISHTICNQTMLSARTRPAFRPAPCGTDHSLKDYYYLLAGTGMKKCVTEPYISLASGNLCTTISAYFENAYRQKFIICIDTNSNSAI
ncbi:MAG: EAL domain-containing protein [Firmicutes bacterium]|nr:EAL domain-containing protein [Bacillota bacterium]